MIIVIGSGPTGVAVSRALLAQGLKVTMLDIGLELEPERQQLLSRMSASPASAWRSAEFSPLHRPFRKEPHSLPRKRAYGSDFVYRLPTGGLRVEQRGTAVPVSAAKGGLSNVWGGAMLPYRQRDIEGWPIPAAEMADHYRSVLEYVPQSAISDDLEMQFPLFGRDSSALNTAPSVGRWLARLQKNRAALGNAGVIFGVPRLCLQGCPRRLIYCASESLRGLLSAPSFKYVGGAEVERIDEREGRVNVGFRQLPGGSRSSFDAERAYVAAGPVGSARIMLASMNAYGHRLRMLDSQYFLLPLYRPRESGAKPDAEVHALAQLFLELEPEQGLTRAAHLQVYSGSEGVGQAIRDRLGFLGSLRGRAAAYIADRIFVIQGYLHSDDSSTMRVSLRREADGEVLVIEAETASSMRSRVRAAVRKLWRVRSLMGVLPLVPALQLGVPGQGSHSGGSFPMRRSPGPFETDVFGRVSGFNRIHVVDSSVFPSVPATTITLAAMANAHRIGSLHSQFAS